LKPVEVAHLSILIMFRRLPCRSIP